MEYQVHEIPETLYLFEPISKLRVDPKLSADPLMAKLLQISDFQNADQSPGQFTTVDLDDPFSKKNRPSYDTTRILDLNELLNTRLLSADGNQRVEKFYISHIRSDLPVIAVIRTSLSGTGKPVLIGKTIFITEDVFNSAFTGDERMEKAVLDLLQQYALTNRIGSVGNA